MSDPLKEAISIIRSLLAWAPDDLSSEEMPQEWIDAQEFSDRYGA